MRRKKTVWNAGAPLALTLAMGLGGAGAVWCAQERPGMAHGEAAKHVMLTPDALKWAPIPSLPPGAQSAVVAGDPTKPGPFTMRVRLPARYRVPPHTHPADEHVTILSGTLHMGLGERFDTTKGKALPAGSFSVMPVGTNHFAWTVGAVTLQVHGMGPWGITYVNPADDPRKK
jgi:quercetin dioxygenase-like cupin family protein